MNYYQQFSNYVSIPIPPVVEVPKWEVLRTNDCETNLLLATATATATATAPTASSSSSSTTPNIESCFEYYSQRPNFNLCCSTCSEGVTSDIKNTNLQYKFTTDNNKFSSQAMQQPHQQQILEKQERKGSRPTAVRLDDAIVDSIISKWFEPDNDSDCSSYESNKGDFLDINEVYPYEMSLDFNNDPNRNYKNDNDYSNKTSDTLMKINEHGCNVQTTCYPNDHHHLHQQQQKQQQQHQTNYSINLSSFSSSSLSQQGHDQLRNEGKVIKTNDRLIRKKVKRSRARARPWSVEEQKRFEESLELYGRNWELCAAYIGTRRASLVRSHAQKYLIKLWKLGKPLPKKVAESGSGYTLSGKPLHPDSASAKSYLIKLPCPPSEPALTQSH